MKRKKAALYNPYLDTLGGGEKHVLSILKVLEEENYSLDIFWDKNLQNEFKVKFNLSFDYLINFVPNIFNKRLAWLKKFSTLKKYDYFFYVTNGSYFFSSAKNNFIFAMVPQASLYKMTPMNKLKTAGYKFIANSKLTQNYLKSIGIDSLLLYPYLDQRFIQAEPMTFKKEKIILTVGRFFRHLHSKNQNQIIKSFKALKKQDKTFKDYKLVLAGGLKDEDLTYFESLKKLAGNDRSILFRPNVNFHELYSLYEKASFYWHFTGLGVDEKLQPEEVEHLGITPLEAMAMGCITFCINSGGPKENIIDGKSGLLFRQENELIKKMQSIARSPQQQTRIKQNAKNYVLANFSYSKFRQNVKKLIL